MASADDVSNPSSIPNCLSIAGLDPSGGAGILADVKAFSALKTYACAVITAITAQNTQGVSAVWPVAPAQLVQQLGTLWADVKIDAVKVGMIGERLLIEALAQQFASLKPKQLVLDPVMVAKSGDRLLDPQALEALRETLLPLSHILTPNLPEAGELLNESVVDSLSQMYRVAERLHTLQARKSADERWIYLKGGHLPGHEAAVDLLFNGDRMIPFSAPRVSTRNTHGTGCSLSAALAAGLSRAIDVPTAVQQAKDYVTQSLQHADRLTVGQGQGPLHHFHRWW